MLKRDWLLLSCGPTSFDMTLDPLFSKALLHIHSLVLMGSLKKWNNKDLNITIRKGKSQKHTKTSQLKHTQYFRFYMSYASLRHVVSKPSGTANVPLLSLPHRQQNSHLCILGCFELLVDPLWLLSPCTPAKWTVFLYRFKALLLGGKPQATIWL